MANAEILEVKHLTTIGPHHLVSVMFRCLGSDDEALVRVPAQPNGATMEHVKVFSPPGSQQARDLIWKASRAAALLFWDRSICGECMHYRDVLEKRRTSYCMMSGKLAHSLNDEPCGSFIDAYCECGNYLGTSLEQSDGHCRECEPRHSGAHHFAGGGR